MADPVALPDLVAHAGAVMTERDGRPVPAHYGSPAGELAVCVTGVGLALRSDLVNLSVTAAPRALAQLVKRTLDRQIAPGGAALEAGAWWCMSSDAHELVLISRSGAAARLVRALRHEVVRLPDAELTDHSEERVILCVVGRRAGRVLEGLGVFGPAGDPRGVPPFLPVSLDGRQVTWLLQAETAALAMVDAASAAATWRAIDDAGRPYGISCVGIESIDRYLLTERASHRGITLL